MKKVSLLIALAISISCLFVNETLAQTTSSSGSTASPQLDTYTITITGKILGSPTSGLNIKVTPGGQNVAGLATGATFKATGATQLLTDVSATNTISVVWSGAITDADGKAIITGMLKPGTTVNSTFIVNNVSKDGGTEIYKDGGTANQVTVAVALSSSQPATPPPTTTPEDTKPTDTKPTDTKPTDTTPTDTKPKPDEPSVTLTAPEEVTVKRIGLNTFRIKVVSKNFSGNALCEIDVSDDSFLRIKPRKFILGKTRKSGTLIAKVPVLGAREIVDNDSPEDIAIDVSCSNNDDTIDVVDSVDVTLSPPQ